MGRDVTQLTQAELREVKANYGVTFQQGALFTSLTVLQNVQLPMLEHLQLSPRALDELAMLKVRLVGLSGRGRAQISRAAVGRHDQARRAGAGAGAGSALLMLDEPTAGLDPISAAAFDELLMDLRPQLKLTVIMITHDLDTIFRTCNRVGVIIDRKMTSDTLEGITRQSASVDPGLFPRRTRPALRPRRRTHRMEREANYTAVGAFVLLDRHDGRPVRLLVRGQRRCPRLHSATRSTSRAASRV